MHVCVCICVYVCMHACMRACRCICAKRIPTSHFAACLQICRKPLNTPIYCIYIYIILNTQTNTRTQQCAFILSEIYACCMSISYKISYMRMRTCRFAAWGQTHQELFDMYIYYKSLYYNEHTYTRTTAVYLFGGCVPVTLLPGVRFAESSSMYSLPKTCRSTYTFTHVV